MIDGVNDQPPEGMSASRSSEFGNGTAPPPATTGGNTRTVAPRPAHGEFEFAPYKAPLGAPNLPSGTGVADSQREQMMISGRQFFAPSTTSSQS